MDNSQREKYAKSIDRLLEDEKLRKQLNEQLRDNALDVVDSLGIDIEKINRSQLQELGLKAPGGGVALPAIPLVSVGVFVVSQIEDTIQAPTDDDDDDDDDDGGGGTGGTDE